MFGLSAGERKSSKKEEFTKKEKEKTELIKKVKEYGESLGLHSTKNFKEYQEKVSRYNIFFYNKKIDVPFSYVDPKIAVIQSDFDTLEGSVKGYEINTEEYDVHFYTTIGVSGGTYITKKLLEHSNTTIAQTVLHEDLHDNMDLPRHMEETAALIFGVAAASRYFKESERSFRSTMSFTLLDALIVEELHSDISLLNQEYQDGKIDLKTYLSRRDEKIANSWYGSMAEISQHHTYKHYFTLFYRLLKAMKYDLPRFVKFLQNFPYKQPVWTNGHEWYFAETLRIEKEAEVYVESTISTILEEEGVEKEDETASSTSLLKIMFQEDPFFKKEGIKQELPIENPCRIFER